MLSNSTPSPTILKSATSSQGSRLGCPARAARKALWFSMATVSDSIDSEMMLRIIRESKNAKQYNS